MKTLLDCIVYRCSLSLGRPRRYAIRIENRIRRRRRRYRSSAKGVRSARNARNQKRARTGGMSSATPRHMVVVVAGIAVGGRPIFRTRLYRAQSRLHMQRRVGALFDGLARG